MYVTLLTLSRWSARLCVVCAWQCGPNLIPVQTRLIMQYVKCKQCLHTNQCALYKQTRDACTQTRLHALGNVHMHRIVVFLLKLHCTHTVP